MAVLYLRHLGCYFSDCNVLEWCDFNFCLASGGLIFNNLLFTNDGYLDVPRGEKIRK